MDLPHLIFLNKSWILFWILCAPPNSITYPKVFFPYFYIEFPIEICLYYKICLIIVTYYSPVPRDVGKGRNTLPNITGYRGVDSPVFFDCLGGNVGLGREFLWVGVYCVFKSLP